MLILVSLWDGSHVCIIYLFNYLFNYFYLRTKKWYLMPPCFIGADPGESGTIQGTE